MPAEKDKVPKGTECKGVLTEELGATDAATPSTEETQVLCLSRRERDCEVVGRRRVQGCRNLPRRDSGRKRRSNGRRKRGRTGSERMETRLLLRLLSLRRRETRIRTRRAETPRHFSRPIHPRFRSASCFRTRTIRWARCKTTKKSVRVTRKSDGDGVCSLVVSFGEKRVRT